MNELIKEIESKSWIHHDGYTLFDREKFAELIIEECINTIQSNQWFNGNQSWSKGMLYSAELIKEHFGVEE